MNTFALIVPWMVFLPLIGMLLNLVYGKQMGERAVGIVASAAVGVPFLIALGLIITLSQTNFAPVIVNPPLLDGWISIPSAAIEIPWQFRVDTLSVTMMLVITGVGFLIHIYSIGYMHNDERYPRFFVYLNLFIAFMLVLVTANNYLMMFVGWEGVGLCSFLLIGFWFDRKHGEGWRNSNAARKAFIVNRVGDFGFMLAIMLTFWTFGTLDYTKPNEAPIVAAAAASDTSAAPISLFNSSTTPIVKPIAGKGVFGQTEQWLNDGTPHSVRFGATDVPLTSVLTLITLLMVIGVVGKSAQIPLFTWLPDAMAGPTPVSALIHAATMVTAGIYLITRSNVLFHAAPITSALVTIIGAATAAYAGYIAIGQWDIKKVLAYSTVSQLGFMVAAAGIGAYTVAFFHLVTHAFFKGLLFLGAGSVIHGMEHGHHALTHAAHDDTGAHGSTGTEGDHGTSLHASSEADSGSHSDVEHGAAEHTSEGATGAHGVSNTPIPEERATEEAFDPQDMRNMGGLRRKMPVTYWTYLIGTLALSGIFPFAGFWSKDDILGSTFRAGVISGRFEGYIAFGLLLLAAFFTAFYMWRQIRYVFLGSTRTAAAEHAGESSAWMTVPLIVLAVLATVGGLFNLPAVFANPGANIQPELLTRWLGQTVTYVPESQFNVVLAIVALAVALGGILIANYVYGRANPLTKRGNDPLVARVETRQVFNLANAKLYADEIYDRLIVQPFVRTSRWLSNFVDRQIIDRGFMGIAGIVRWSGQRLSGVQTGYVRTYTFTMLIGVVVVLIIILFPLLRLLAGG